MAKDLNTEEWSIMSAEIMDKQKDFLPAAGHDLFLPLYDPLVRWLGFEQTRQDLIEQAKVETNHYVLDVGCGTGTLAVQLKRQYPALDIVGIDPDPKALRRAQAKARRGAVSVKFDRGFADELPYEDGVFDRVFSSFMFHHLDEQDREKTMHEVLRVLKPGGSFHLLDFVSGNQASHGFLHRFLHSHAELKHNSDAGLLQSMSRAGFTESKKIRGRKMLLGLMKTGEYEARKSATC